MTDPHRNRSFTRTVFSSLPVLAFMVFACSDGGGDPDPDPDPPRADSIALQPSSISFDAIGDTVRIQATVLDQYGDPMQGLVVVWASDNIAVARVDQTGLVTSVGDGSTVVRAQASSKRNSLTVDVAQEPSRLEALEGDGQQQWTGFALRDPLRVRLTDGAGSPVVGEAVAWEVLEGEGTVTPAAPVTDPDGEVQAIWVLGEGESGAQKVSATVEGLDPVEFNATGSSPLTLLNVEPLTAPMLDSLVGRLLARDSLGLPESGIPIEFWDNSGFVGILLGRNTPDVD